MAKITYGIAEYSRWTGRVDYIVHAPMDDVKCGGLYEFFESAGANGWELCSSFPSGAIGANVAQTDGSAHRTTDPSEYITFIFKKV